MMQETLTCTARLHFYPGGNAHFRAKPLFAVVPSAGANFHTTSPSAKGQPKRPTWDFPAFSIALASGMSSFTSQFAHTNLPFKKAASGLASHRLKLAGSDTRLCRQLNSFNVRSKGPP